VDATTLTVGLLALAGAAILAFLSWQSSRRRSAREKLPPAMRPAYSDDQLERNVLERHMGWGLVLTVFFALFIPLYLVYDMNRIEGATDERFVEQVVRGEELYQANCAECHGSNLAGGAAASPFEGDDAWPAPALNDFVVRYEDNPNVDDIEGFLWETLYWGRPGSPMPAYGEEAAGPFTDEQIEDVKAFMLFNQVGEDEAQEMEAEDEAEDPDDEAEDDEADDANEAEDDDADDLDEADDVASAEQAAGTVAAADGEELYTQNCMRCHGADLQGWDGEEARPGYPLIGVFERHTSIGILGILRQGIIRPGATIMPPYQDGYQNERLEDEELVAIIDYLRERQPEDLLPEEERDPRSLEEIEALADDDDADDDADEEPEDEGS